MKINEETRNKILKTIEISRQFMNNYRDLDNPDIMFVLTAFENKYSLLVRDLGFGDEFDRDAYEASIYDFDNIIFEWMECLTYKVKTFEKGNTLYDVLFSTLQSINRHLENSESYTETFESDGNVDESLPSEVTQTI